MNNMSRRFAYDVSPIFFLSVVGLVYVFVGALYVYGVLGLVLPAAIVLYLLSGALLISGYFLGSKLCSRSCRTLASHGFSVRFDAAVLLISVCAVFALFFDRYFLRGIDYFSLGMAGARAEINTVGASGSVYSIFGNLFAYSFLVPLVNTVYQWESRKWSRFFLIVGPLIVMLIFSYLMGGRTVLMITVVMLLSCAVGRYVVGLQLLPKGIGVFNVSIFAVFSFFLLGFVFYVRANTFGGGDSALYVDSMCAHLTSFLSVDAGLSWSCNIGVVGGYFSDYLNYMNAVMLYGFHVIWVSDSVVSQGGGGSVLLAGLGNLLFDRIGVEILPHDYSGYFVPAAAGVWHDLGWLGLVVVFFVSGFFLRIALALHCKGHLWVGRYGFIFFYSASLLALLISPANLPGFILAVVCVLCISFFWFLARVLALSLASGRLR